ncbi:aldo/keto reductase family protein [Brevibacillus fulvus]|uniref:Voltage-dependent potassium channel beta subunit n=1 Tax=Brevibacillus fulvus TaxID=1125967 RepID=A0A938Y0V4_9BACL|nr:aldo/keto reductase family protein [Brevibacillus fulvus]MBM7591296.1 voltage-dependent potassium channel beta subunit [Brevibacillus fulvus]
MEYRRLGKTGLKVSEISLGSWLTFGKSVDKETTRQTIHRAYELGVNFFDTANVYARGEAEIVVGEALASLPRESYVLATKVFWPMGDGPNDRGLSRKHVFEQAHASLKRLNVDYIDLYYCHRFDPETPVEETLRTIDDLIRQGKILYAGVSEWTAAQIQQALGTADKYLLDRIVVNQPVYNMLNRYIEKEVLPLCEANGIGQVVFSPLAQGVLTGKYRPGQAAPAGSRGDDSSLSTSMKNYLSEENLLKVEQLEKVAQEAGLTLVQLSLAWILRQPGVSSALVGATRPEQIERNVTASGITLSADVLAKIEQILG